MTAATSSPSSSSFPTIANQILPMPATQQTPHVSKISLAASRAATFLAQPENTRLINSLSLTAFGAWGFWINTSAPTVLGVPSAALLNLCSAFVLATGAIQSAQNLGARGYSWLRPAE